MTRLVAERRTQKRRRRDVIEERAYAVGLQAALWGRPFPEYLRMVPAALRAGGTSVNYLHKFTTLRTAADRSVRTPNDMAIEACGVADLTEEPLVVNVPALHEHRWYIVQLGDTFDEVAYNIGGYKGPEPGLFLLTGPDYRGPVPANMKEVRLRTKIALVTARVFVNGEADLPAARAVQKGFHLLPLSVFQHHGLIYEIGPETDFSRLQFVPTAPELLRLFDQIGFGMHLYLSASDDHADALVASFHLIGLSAAKGFDWQSLDEPTRRGLARAGVTAEQIVDDAYVHAAEVVNGWHCVMADGRAGQDFAVRGAMAKYLLGGNVPEQMLYLRTAVDEEGRQLSGANRYVLHFDKGQTPPVAVCWHLCLYDDKEFFVANALGRYSLGSFTDGLTASADGSVAISIQRADPGGDLQSNWLPGPAGRFNLTMRLYGAETPILDGSYRLPAVRRVG
jgi:hypothetical protein